MAAPCTEERAKRLAQQARFRARTLARRIQSMARSRTVVDTGQARSGWRQKRRSNVWTVFNDSFNHPVHAERSGAGGALSAAVNRHTPAVHVDVSGEGVSVTITPWTAAQILLHECRPVRGLSLFVPAATVPVAQPAPQVVVPIA